MDKENEEAKQNSNMQYIHEYAFEKGLFEISVRYPVVYEKLFDVAKHADVIMVEYHVHTQRNVVE